MNDARPITPIVFVWDNFGPLHHDRLKAAGEHYNVLGIEVADKSKTYAWEGEDAEKYQKTTLFQNAATDDISHWRKFIALTTAIKKSKAKHVFLCNYNQPYVFFTAIMLRLMVLWMRSASLWVIEPGLLRGEILAWSRMVWETRGLTRENSWQRKLVMVRSVVSFAIFIKTPSSTP